MENVIGAEAMPGGVAKTEIFESLRELILGQIRDASESRTSDILAKMSLRGGGLLRSNSWLRMDATDKDLLLESIEHFESVKPCCRKQ